VLPDVYLELATDAGVFSPGRLDPGTRLLLEESPVPPASGDLLDLGCGYGPVACVLAKRSPGATVWAVDVNERALELCARNARAAGLDNVRCVTPGDAARPAEPGRFRVPGGRAQPRRRLVAPLAVRAGLARDAARRPERLPPAPGGFPGRTSRGD